MQNLHTLASWLVMGSSPSGPFHLMLFEHRFTPWTLLGVCRIKIATFFNFYYEKLKRCWSQLVVFSYIRQKHSEIVCDLWKWLKLPVTFCFHAGTFILELFSRLTSNPAWASVSLHAPISPSAQASSSPSHLSHLFKDGCAGRWPVGWSDGLWR